MNRKQLLIIVVVGLVVGGIGLYLNKQKSASFQRGERIAGEKLLSDFPINDVTQITLRQHTGEVNLVKADSWTVKERDGYPAHEEDIIEFARKLWDLKAAQSQKIGASQLGRLELLPPDKGGTNSGTLVELKNKDGKPIKSVVLGKKSMRDSGDSSFGGGGFPNGRWLYLPDKPGTAYLVSEAFSEIEPKPERWLKKDLFKVEKLKTVSVTYTNATNSWKLYREMENGELKLADAKDGEKLDTGKSSSAGYVLSSPSFVDVASAQAKPEETGMDNPLVAKIETFDGFNYTVKIGKKTPEDNYYLNVGVSAELAKERAPGKDEKPEDKDKLDKEFKEKIAKLEEKLKQEKAFEKWTYLVSKWTVDALLKERKDLLVVEKKEEPKSEEKPAPPVPPVPAPEAKKPDSAVPVAEPKKEEKPPEKKPETKPEEKP
jgi:hypothetical protein